MAETKGIFRRVFGGAEAPSAETRPAPQALQPRASWLQRLRQGLARSSNALSDGITSIFTKRKLDAAALDEFEDMLIKADLGVSSALAITETLRAGRFDKEITDEEVKTVLAGEIEKVLTPVARPLAIDAALKPHVILVVGVNGTGKTTTIGKLAAKLRGEVIAREPGSDAAGLAFDALNEAKETGASVLLIDTAGRLQNKDELMAELEKVVRVIRKLDPSAPHTVLLTLDATTGQNALSQVEIFGKRAGVTGLVMTKLDGTARGGILVAIAAKYGLPVHFIGIGEGVDDLEPFAAGDFAKALAGL
jgi:fused signal recognition particle receptor